MGREYEAAFWREADEDYQDIVREFDRNIEIIHPEYVTSNRMCVCLDYCSYCGWAASSVKYYEYRGEGV